MTQRTALITGASAGIGTAFAEAYARRRYNLVLTARRADRLEALAARLKERFSIDVTVLPADLADPHAVRTLTDALHAQTIDVDVLINNAGYGLPGTYLSTSWDEQDAFLRVLLTAPCELAHRLLPGMLERRYGRIINVASLAGYTPGMASHTLYGAVKAAMIRFSESLHAESKADGVHCTALCPGLTRTEFHDVNETRGQLEDVPDFMWQEAGEVVESGIAACDKGQPIIVTGGVNKTIAALSRILPDPIGRRLSASQSKRFRKM